EEEERKERDQGIAVAEITRMMTPGQDPDQTHAEVVQRHVSALIDLAVHGLDAKERDLAQELLKLIPISTKGGDVRRAFELLVRIGEFTPDENIFVRRAGVRNRFSGEVLEAADSAADLAAEGPAPRDATELLTLAIDDARTTEVDDAFAIEGERLYVFIADVAAFVPAGGVLDEEAQRRVSTVYLAEGKIPMLPSVLSEGAASLEQGVTRRALCFSGEMSDDGRLLGLEVEEVFCRVDRRLTYVETDEILERKESADEVERLVQKAGAWLKLHRERRAMVGALLLQRNEIDLRVGDDGQVTVSPVNANGPARQMISEMMVATCAAVGSWCYDQQVPCVYRAQAAPDDARNMDGGEVSDTMDQHRVLRRLKPSTLTTRPQGHYTLGVSGYTQVTSPLRRYQDLVMHQQLKSYLRRRRPRFTDRDLMGIFQSVDRGAAAVRR
ncbi:MAG: ribonuclease catalytic domain-containing protein, partial [Myxococcota bacterium]|nr:ribonuclease catalytic domain-containing protein [Myxococcota bacterium]